MKEIILTQSPRSNKKWRVVINDNQNIKTIDFGASGYEDYTIHKNPKRQQSYIRRHESNENWNADGVNTAGWWSRWLLWEKPGMKSAINFVASKLHDLGYDFYLDNKLYKKVTTQ
jgi:hypothetical protein